MYAGIFKRPVTMLALLAGMLPRLAAGDAAAPLEMTVQLGDYRFTPDEIEVAAGRRVILKLVNMDGITPHNFTLREEVAGISISQDVAAGATEIIEFTAPPAGDYRFYCDKKLPFMKSHRDRGMEGTLRVPR